MYNEVARMLAERDQLVMTARDFLKEKTPAEILVFVRKLADQQLKGSTGFECFTASLALIGLGEVLQGMVDDGPVA